MSWENKPLGEILDLSGRHRAGDQDLPVLSITMRHGLVDQADKFKKRIASLDTANYRIAYKNELVVGFPIDEGVLGFQTKYPAGIVSPAYNIWRLKNDVDCYIPYLERYLRSSQARSLYASRMQGAVARRRSLTKTDFLELKVPFPSFDDQARISHLLGKVEGLTAQRKQQLQQLDDLLKSKFLDMFGDPVRNEKGWETGTSSVYAEMVTVGVVVRPASHYVEHGVIALRSLNIKPNRIDLSDLVHFSQDSNDGVLSKSRLKANDVVVVRTGKTGTASVGPAALDGANCIDLIVVRPRRAKIHPQFLTCLLNSERGLALVASLEVGGIQKHFNIGALNKIPFPLPPIELQSHFADIVEKVEGIKSSCRQSLVDLEVLYGTLSQQAFKGELDLSRVAMPAPAQHVAPASIGEQATMPEPVVQTVHAIQLPDTDSLPAALEDDDARKGLIEEWLEAYRNQLGDAPFSAQHFMAAAQGRVLELHPDNDFELGANDYEQIKAWVFAQISARRLKQTREIAIVNKKRVFGNKILLRVRRAPAG